MTLTKEQQQALEELGRSMAMKGAGAAQDAAGNTAAPEPAPASPAAPGQDWLQTWLGVSRPQLVDGLRSMLRQKDGYEERFMDWFEANPLNASLEFLGIAAWAFYRAEKGRNPKIQTYIDAFYYITTCASVGYADVFAATQTGRAIAALVMTVGPALTNKTLDRPKGR